jgi:hypothetical protein
VLGPAKTGHGNNWVIAAVVVRLPMISRPVAIPVLAKLVIKGTSSASRLWLARRIAAAIAGALPGRDIHVVADSAYAGGHLSVTRFECPTRATVIILCCLNSYVKREVLRKASGCLGITTLTDWRSRMLYSISMWRDIEDIYRMGDVHRHVLASRR